MNLLFDRFKLVATFFDRAYEPRLHTPGTLIVMNGREREGVREGREEGWMIVFQEWEIRFVRAWLSFGNEISNMKIVYERASSPWIKFTSTRIRGNRSTRLRSTISGRDGKFIWPNVTSARSKMYIYCFVIRKFFFVFYRWIFFSFFFSYNLW